MLHSMLRKAVRGLAAHLGVHVHRRNMRLDLEDFALFLAKRGFSPGTVIDVGVAYGTDELYRAFPSARLLLVEPLEEWRSALDRIRHKYGADYVVAAAGSRRGQITINVHQDLMSSSSLKEVEGASVDGTPRVVPMMRLDDLCDELATAGPYLVKVDVQGAELDVVQGASRILPSTDVIVLEVSLFRGMTTNPDFFEVVSFMRNCGFVVYDIFNLNSRPLDGALGQVDLAFVKEGGAFRTSHAHATPDQRRDATEQVLRHIREVSE